jgi:hypothetical protein
MTDLADQDAGPLATRSFPGTRAVEGGWWLDRECGATALIVDMTATVSCGHAGAEAVERAYRRAVVSGTLLRLVVTQVRKSDAVGPGEEQA